MSPPVFRLAAAAEVEEAYQWYEAQRSGLGDEFLAAIQAAFDSIVAHPQAFPVLHRDTRRALLKRFPYGLFYRLVGEDIIVVACFHAKRDPRDWMSRR